MGRFLRRRRAGARPHVLVIVENCSFPSDRRVWLETTALVSQGYDVSVISPQDDDLGRLSFEIADGVQVHRYAPPTETGSARSFAWGYLLAWFRTARLAVRVYRKQRFQVMQACNPPDTYFALALLFKPLGVRFLFDQHDFCPEVYATRFPRPSKAVRSVLLLLERLTHRAADQVITVNESCRDLLLARTRTPPDRLTVVRTGPDVNRLKAVPALPELKHGARYLCCYLGVMGPQDGVDLVIRAADVLVNGQQRRDVHFAMLGFGECLPGLQELTSELGLDDFVTFTGRVESGTISDYLSTGDLGLQPDPKTEFTDLCSMVKTVEYMAFGLPVVSMDLTETQRSAGEAALYISERSPESFASAIARLLDDTALRDRMSEVGLARARGSLAWEHQATAYLEVMSKLAGGRAPEPARSPARQVDAADLIEPSAGVADA